MLILSVSIMAAAAGTLHPMGLRIDNAIDMVKLLEPLSCRIAISIFVAGIICAVVSPLALILLLLLYNKKERMGEHSVNLTTNLILGINTLFTILMALAVVIGIRNLLK